MHCTGENPCSACLVLEAQKRFKDFGKQLKRRDAQFFVMGDVLVLTNEFVEGVHEDHVFGMIVGTLENTPPQSSRFGSPSF